jgi:beta-glucosidase
MTPRRPGGERSPIDRRGVLRLGASVSLLALLPSAARAASGAAAPLYKDQRAPIDLRVRDLLSRMTLEEKAAQLITLSRTKRDVMDEELRFDRARASAAYPNGIGQVARPSDRGGAATANNNPGQAPSPGRHDRVR